MSFLKKVRYYYYTLRYIKPVQFIYQLKYRLNRIHSLKKITFKDVKTSKLPLLPLPTENKILEISDSHIKATVLNLSCDFQKHINWSERRHGKLWNYHLQYADFLKQGHLSIHQREDLILDLYQWLNSGKLAPEPYPASLRIINVIRFLSGKHQIERKNELIEFVYSELYFLENRLEYHLLGNHLLENSFALLMGGTFFQKDEWIKTAKRIFHDQIPEQILDDGGHVERSPMYHLILLYRFLEALYYLPSASGLNTLFSDITKKMLAWIDQMSFRNGDFAHFNDSTDHQSYSKEKIFQMAEKCGIKDYPRIALSNSGYRRFEIKDAEILFDTSGIEPGYQPGHAHADSLSFVLYFKETSIVADPGVSTYEAGEQRDWERSTKAHNTITYKEQNTADVWNSFRVAKRPIVQILEESDTHLELCLTHRLQSNILFKHYRNVECSKNFIEVTDTVNLKAPVDGHLHLHPGIDIKELSGKQAILENGIIIAFQNILNLQKFMYEFCEGFNIRTHSTGLKYSFDKNASFRIIFPNS